MTTFAPWQRPPRPVRRVRCAVCYRPVPVRSTVPLWGERVCKGCLSTDDRRHSYEFTDRPWTTSEDRQ